MNANRKRDMTSTVIALLFLTATLSTAHEFIDLSKIAPKTVRSIDSSPGLSGSFDYSQFD